MEQILNRDKNQGDHQENIDGFIIHREMQFSTQFRDIRMVKILFAFQGMSTEILHPRCYWTGNFKPPEYNKAPEQLNEHDTDNKPKMESNFSCP